MRTIETTIYKFNELSEEGKDKAVEYLFDLNVDHDWWMFVYEDAENVGLKITGFDIDRGGSIKGDFIGDALETAETIRKTHGNLSATYKTAADFLSYRKYLDDDEDLDDLEAYFLNTILGDYLIILANEYDYLTSEEAIIDTIEANVYEFTEDGVLI